MMRDVVTWIFKDGIRKKKKTNQINTIMLIRFFYMVSDDNASKLGDIILKR